MEARPCVATISPIVASVLAALLVVGCVAGPDGRVRPDPNVFSREGTVPVAAGLVGALVCNQLFKGHGSKEGWTAICGVGGYFLGRSFVAQSNTVLERNRINESSSWTDPDGRQVTMVPTETYYEGSTPCRQYRTTVEIEGETEILTGRACRQYDGTWRAVD